MRTGEQGFSLIEALVAFAILAMAGLALSAAVMTGLDSARRARDAALAMSIAQSQLAVLEANPALGLGVRHGTADRFGWRSSVTPAVHAVDPSGYALFWIEVVVAWPGRNGANESVDLQSAAIGRRP